ncbi:hypothetical protein [Thermoproteus tenax]|uniref:Uncharacterized protein n=1 Tax=Thermoproteus tenax (strain ATCC 35583 / DSM 2078 / JCM 9277 / NBRC 100435 / Kra 1) TaxID=768679 RepID=G4RNM0_THETK|nr:hypothetical protein [Thermoproteus tenax]CCC81164.1 hypothetical protein TTX_0498 [Thermoproteus tenax Kra 1]
MRALALAAFFALAITAVFASLAFFNETQYSINATLPPVMKDGNLSLYPLARAYWAPAGGYNVTYYIMKFVPGWPEYYEVGVFVPKFTGWSASLQRLSQIGTANYAISLDGSVEISSYQSSGPPVPTPATVTWTSISSQRYSVLAQAVFQNGGISAVQLVNFTALPMSRLYSYVFTCPSYSISSFNSSSPWLYLITTGKSEANVTSGILYTDGKNGWAAGFVNVTQWLGSPIPASSSFTVYYYLQASLTGNDYLQVNFFISSSPNDPKPYLEVIYYYSVNGRSPANLSKYIYGYSVPYISIYLNITNKKKQWLPLSIPQVYSTGYIVGFALVTYSPNGNTIIEWKNVNLTETQCPLPSNWSVYGQSAAQTSSALVLQGSPYVVFYRSLISGALTYISNFTGAGTYAVFSQSLTPIFGVNISGDNFYALCGSTSVYLGNYPASAWVELRPLNDWGDIILRDVYGNILARYGCFYSAQPAYVGYSTAALLRVYNITALG